VGDKYDSANQRVRDQKGTAQDLASQVGEGLTKSKEKTADATSGNYLKNYVTPFLFS